VHPETVVGWHRAGFKLYGKWISRRRMQSGRKPTPKPLRELIFRMVMENSTWGAPRIHGELKMLGYEISERTVLRWVRKAPRNAEPARRWAAFLSNHREAIAAMDLFTVPTVTFGVLYGFFVIAHERRHISSLQRDQATDKCVRSPAIAGSVSVRRRAALSDLRSRRELQ